MRQNQRWLKPKGKGPEEKESDERTVVDGVESEEDNETNDSDESFKTPESDSEESGNVKRKKDAGSSEKGRKVIKTESKMVKPKSKKGKEPKERKERRKEDPKLSGKLAGLMAHRETTAKKYYLLADKSKASVEASKKPGKLMWADDIGNKDESDRSEGKTRCL